MARKIEEHLIVHGRLVAQTPLHVGGLACHFDTDLPLALDGRHRLVVPGTSLAGAFRAWCEAAFPITAKHDWDVVKALWGLRRQDEREWEHAGDDAGHASYILIEDARVELPAGAAVEVRDHVGIDRVLGAASERIKFDRAVLPRGTVLHLRMELELPSQHCAKGSERVDNLPRKAGAVLGHLLHGLEQGEIRIGAARTRGLGRVKLEGLKIETRACNSKPALLALLQGQTLNGSDLTAANLRKRDAKLTPTRPPHITFEVQWRPLGPLMVKAGFEGNAVDSLPLVSDLGGNACALVLPGSSVKGALRSRAEQIVRTVLTAHADEDSASDVRQRFIDQLQLPLVRALFGAPGESSERATPLGDDSIPSDEPRPGRAALAVDDCYARQTMPQDDWRQVVDADNLRAACGAETGPSFKPTVHVAIDRWTGGAADQLLYSVLEPHEVPWEVLRFEIDLMRLRAGRYEGGHEEEREAAVALFLLTLRELVLGRVPLGFGTMRGMGAIEVEAIEVTGTGLGGTSLEALEGRKRWEETKLDDELRTHLQSLRQPWRRWIAAVQRSASEEARP